jgi:SAM-dependent methyltransferase
MTTHTTSRAFFEAKYQENGDPWAFASNDYEQDRYSKTLHALDSRRYKRAFEPGCSIGILTAHLASICEHIDAIDISPTAVRQARQNCADLSNVSVNCGSLPKDVPEGVFDLIVLSEIGYYFDRQELFVVGSRVAECLEPLGVLLAVHWLGHSSDHLIDGDAVHEVLGHLDGLSLEFSERHVGFRIDRWVRG